MAETQYIPPRRKARLCAVQAVYQSGQRIQSASEIIKEFHDSLRLKEADIVLFDALVTGIFEEKQLFIDFIRPQISSNWTWERLDTVVQAILLCGVYELWRMPETPAAVIIDEYLELVHAFELEQERPFVHKVLDGSGRTLRA